MRVAGPVCACAVLVFWWWLGGAAAAPRHASATPPVDVLVGDAASPAAPAEETDATDPGECGEDPSRPTLEGTVVDPEGRGVEQVVMHATYLTTHSCYRMYLGFETVRTDQSGRFRLDVHPRACWVELWIDAPGWAQPAARTVYTHGTEFADGTPADARALRLTRGEDWPRQRIVLERGEAIAGVVETAAGVPAPDVRVKASWPGGTARVRTDERGRFSILAPAPAVLAAHVWPGRDAVREDYWMPPFSESESRPPRYEGLVSEDADAIEGPFSPGTRDVRLVLRELHRLDLLVLDPDGPMTGEATVRMTEWRSGRDTTWRPYVRDGQLEYESPSVTAGIYDVEVLPPGHLLPVRFVATVPGEPLVVRCPVALRIEGLLEGDALKDFEVTWTGPCNASFEDRPQQGRTVRVGTGDFNLGGIGDGVGDLYARREGDARCALVTGCRAGRGVVRMTLAEGCSISGRVDAPAGLDPSALDVRAVRGLLDQHARVRPDGTFSIVGLPPGAFRVELVSRKWSAGGLVDWWTHDARDDVETGTGDIMLHVRLPATDPGNDKP